MGKFPTLATGRTKDIAAEALGRDRRTIDKIKFVVDEAAKPDALPEVAKDLSEMDRTGKVTPAFKAARVQMCLLLKPVIEAMMKANQKAGASKGGKSKVHQNSDEPKEETTSTQTTKEIAKLAGVSHDTVHRVELVSGHCFGDVLLETRNGNFGYRSNLEVWKLVRVQKFLDNLPRHPQELHNVIDFELSNSVSFVPLHSCCFFQCDDNCCHGLPFLVTVEYFLFGTVLLFSVR